MRGRVAMVLCALASGAVLSVLVLGTKAPMGQVVRNEGTDARDRVADDPDSWRDDLWKIADDLREQTERSDQAGEDWIECKANAQDARRSVEEAKLAEEVAQMDLKMFNESTRPARTKDLEEEIDKADVELKLAQAQLKVEEEKPEPEPGGVAIAERNWLRYHVKNAQYLLDKAKMSAKVFKEYQAKREIASRLAAMEKAKIVTLAAKGKLSIADEKAKTILQRLDTMKKILSHQTKANDALSKALDLESKWRASRDSKTSNAELRTLERDAKAAVAETRTLWRDAKITIARELRAKHDGLN